MSGTPKRRIRIQWTETAKDCLRKLPPKVRAGLFAKADELEKCDDPRQVHKPLTGPLSGYFRIVYSRYRAVYTVQEEQIASGDTLVTFTVMFVAAGIRQEHSRDDVYRVAKKIVELGLMQVDGKPKPPNTKTGRS